MGARFCRNGGLDEPLPPEVLTLRRGVLAAAVRCSNIAALKAALVHLERHETVHEEDERSTHLSGQLSVKHFQEAAVKPPVVLSCLGRCMSGICWRRSADCDALRSTMVASLEQVRNVDEGMIGLDIGGTLAKMAFMQLAKETCALADQVFKGTGRFHEDLKVILKMQQKEYQVNFVSASTSHLESALSNGTDCQVTDDDPDVHIVVSGGGAHRFADAVHKRLKMTIHPLNELESLVSGLHFLFERNPNRELYTIGADGAESSSAWPERPYPCLLVNIGSGVSILRIDGLPEMSPEERRRLSLRGKPLLPNFVRVGGTACGGATFLGLSRLLTNATTFQDMLDLVGQGDAAQVNTQVHNIYGRDGCKFLGLPPDMTAAHFGKLAFAKGNARDSANEADVAAALLLMVVQEATLLARAFSRLVGAEVGRPPPVFFAGGFLDKNTTARVTIANSFSQLDLDQVYFLRHADFLGALGSLRQCLESRGCA